MQFFKDFPKHLKNRPTSVQTETLNFRFRRDGDIGPYRGEGGEKNPKLVHQKGDIFLWREGSKSREGSKYFCHMSHMFTLVFLFPHNL